MKKDMACCPNCEVTKKKSCRDHGWEAYENIMELAITKMWRRLGITDRDWSKNKTIFFDENSRLCIENNEKLRAIQNEKKKLLQQSAPNLTDKQIKALFKNKF